MISTFLDSLIGVVSPSWGLQRVTNRALIERVSNHQRLDRLGKQSEQGGYEAGKVNRLTRALATSRRNENAIPRDQLTNLRANSWDLYRNNCQCRKICRSLQSKVIGRGLAPRSQAVTADGMPLKEWRKQARLLWNEVSREFDYRGRPGRGGQHFFGLQRTALLSVILSGSVFWRLRRLSRADQQERRLTLPLQLQLISRERLDESRTGTDTFFGIQVDEDNRRVGYWLLDRHPMDPRGVGTSESRFVSAADVQHLFVEDDTDQLDGVPWFSAALLKMRQRGDYEYNELMASAAAACLVAGYRRSPGQTGGIGLSNPDSDRDLTDGDGNPITHLSPMMFLDLGQSGELQMINPGRPATGVTEFSDYLVRSEAVGLPGVKGSTTTGDYRRSSFASERAGDNDIWPELESIQDWLVCNFCAPIYEEIIDAGVAAGWFDGVEGFSVRDYMRRRSQYLSANWQGPVCRSINPKDDAEASQRRVQNGQSSPQREAALLGADSFEILQEISDFMSEADALDIPLDIVLQILGIQQQDAAGGATTDEGREEQEPDDDTVLETGRVAR